MTFSLRSNRGIAVSAVATCAVIGATTPVWASSGSSHGSDAQTRRALALVKNDAATIAALRAEIDQLKATVAHDRVALSKQRHAVAAATRTARLTKHQAPALALEKAHARAKARAATRSRLSRSTPVSNPADIAVPLDPTARRHCLHGSDPGSFGGTDGGSWDGHSGGSWR